MNEGLLLLLLVYMKNFLSNCAGLKLGYSWQTRAVKMDQEIPPKKPKTLLYTARPEARWGISHQLNNNKEETQMEGENSLLAHNRTILKAFLNVSGLGISLRIMSVTRTPEHNTTQHETT